MDVDFSASGQQYLVVKGNVILRDSSIVNFHGTPGMNEDAFVIANTFSSEYSISLENDSLLSLSDGMFKTQAASGGSVSMECKASDRARMIVKSYMLDTSNSWLLGFFNDEASLRVLDSKSIPTEIYLYDSCDVELAGERTETGVWLSYFESGTYSAVLPDQTGATYSWDISAGWHLKIIDAKIGLAAQCKPGANLTVYGTGAPETGEFKIGYFAGNEDLTGLKTGLQNGIVVPGRLTLNQVQLGPIAWQIYVENNTLATISDSTINEIGIGGDGHVEVDGCVLQLAVLAAMHPASTLTILNSDIWNQLIDAENGAHISIVNSSIHGSLFRAGSPNSAISVTSGAFFDNPPINPAVPMVDIQSGYPNYNPFRTPGSAAKSGQGTVSTAACLNAPF